MLKKVCMVFIAVFAIIGINIVCFAAESDNARKEYQVVIEDDADLLTEDQEKQLKAEMIKLSEEGNVLFVTTNKSISTTSLKYIQNYYYEKYNNNPGVAFYIDMKNRQVCACATGGLDKILTSAKCDIIMDNVYTYAKKGKYYECAKETFAEMYKLLNGEKIQENMKYICNAFLAVMISVLGTYTLYNVITRNRRASAKALISECEVNLQHSAIDVKKTGSHRVYSPIRESSSSSGGGFSGGGGGRRRWILWKRRKPRILKIGEKYE